MGKMTLRRAVGRLQKLNHLCNSSFVFPPMWNTITRKETNKAPIYTVNDPINANCSFFFIFSCGLLKKNWAPDVKLKPKWHLCELTCDNLNGTKTNSAVQCQGIFTAFVHLACATTCTLLDANNVNKWFIRMMSYGGLLYIVEKLGFQGSQICY